MDSFATPVVVFTLCVVHVEVSRKGAKERKTEGAKEITQPFAPSDFLFLAPLRETKYTERPDSDQLPRLLALTI